MIYNTRKPSVHVLITIQRQYFGQNKKYVRVSNNHFQHLLKKINLCMLPFVPVKQIASPLLQFYEFDPKLLLPSGVIDMEAAKEIKNFYFNNEKSSAQKYIEVFRVIQISMVMFFSIFLVRQ